MLVADDDPELLDVVASDLEHEEGADVVRVGDGASMIQEIADGGPFDLIVTDIAMPWMSGMQVAHAARSAQISTPVLVMTARQDGDIERQVDALGGNARLLRKPFELGELHAAVASLLAGRST